MKTLRGKIILGIIISCLLCTIATAFIAYHEIYNISVKYMNSEGLKVGQQIEHDIEIYGISDVSGVQSYVEAAVNQNKELSYIAVCDKNYKAFIHSDKKRIGLITKDKYREKIFKDGNPLGYLFTRDNDEKVYDILVPVKDGHSIIGIISIGMSLKEMYGQINHTVITIISVSLLILLFSIFSGSVIAGSVVGPVKKFIKDFERVSDGDFTVDFSVKTKDEISALCIAMNKTIGSLRKMFVLIKEEAISMDSSAHTLSISSDEFAASSEESSSAVYNVSDGISKQSEDIVGIKNMLNKFGDDLDSICEKLDGVSVSSEGIKTSADEGTVKISNLNKSLEEIVLSFNNIIGKVDQLAEKVNSVGNITTIINEVAAQTNLLALNAAIEAARVGEAGKGFVVVADEIRKLANQSMESSKSIDNLIKDVKNETKNVITTAKEGQTSMSFQIYSIEETIKSFNKILGEITMIVPRIKNVEDTLHICICEKNSVLVKLGQVTEVSEDISSSAQQISVSIEEQTVSLHEFKNLSDNLNNLSNILKENVDKFII